MKNLLFLFILTAGLFVLGCVQHAKPAGQSNTTSTAAAAPAVYACPMKCEGEKTYPQPGQCPVCGMDLEAVTASGTQQDSLQHPQPGHEH